MSNVIKFEEFAVLKAAIEKAGYVVNDHAGGTNYPASEVDVGVYVKITSTAVSATPFLILKNTTSVGYSMNEIYLDEEGIVHLSFKSVGPAIYTNPTSGPTLEDYTKGVPFTIGDGLAYVHVVK